MSEINAAFGLLQPKHMPHVLRRRAEIDALYRQELKSVKGVRCVPRLGK